MSSISFAWFTFGGDAECLIESVKSVRRVYGPDVSVAIFDDAAAPISQAALMSIAPTIYERTRFDRCGNLRGPECVLGILDALDRTARATGTPWVSKIDSDTILVKAWHRADPRWQYQGISWGIEQVGAGANNYMRADLPGRILRRLAGRPRFFRPTDALCPEDNTIALLSVVEAKGGVLIHDSAQASPEPRIAAGWMYDKAYTFEDTQGYSLISFGNRFSISGVDPSSQQSRAIVAQKMEAYNTFLQNC